MRTERDEARYPGRGTWPRFRGRTGIVIMTNRDECGVAFGTVGYRADGSAKSGNVAWFKSYEMRRLPPEAA